MRSKRITESIKQIMINEEKTSLSMDISHKGRAVFGRPPSSWYTYLNVQPAVKDNMQKFLGEALSNVNLQKWLREPDQNYTDNVRCDGSTATYHNRPSFTFLFEPGHGSGYITASVHFKFDNPEDVILYTSASFNSWKEATTDTEPGRSYSVPSPKQYSYGSDHKKFTQFDAGKLVMMIVKFVKGARDFIKELGDKEGSV